MKAISPRGTSGRCWALLVPASAMTLPVTIYIASLELSENDSRQWHGDAFL